MAEFEDEDAEGMEEEEEGVNEEQEFADLLESSGNKDDGGLDYRPKKKKKMGKGKKGKKSKFWKLNKEEWFKAFIRISELCRCFDKDYIFFFLLDRNRLIID